MNLALRACHRVQAPALVAGGRGLGPELWEVKVPYPATLICPAPPRYAEGETVVAFLKQHEGAWYTTSLSYGTLYPQGKDLEDVRTMVLAAAALHKLPLDDARLERRKREWLVQAAALPGTRWHGLDELVPPMAPLRWSRGQPLRSDRLSHGIVVGIITAADRRRDSRLL